MSVKKIPLLGAARVVSLLATSSWTSAQIQRWTPLSEPVLVNGNGDLAFLAQGCWLDSHMPTTQE